MDLVTPGIGLIFWASLVFVLLLLLLRKFAWKPILGAVQNREDSIKAALMSAEEARKEMQNLKADNQKIIHEARIERDNILSEARKLKEELVSKAAAEARDEASKILLQAEETIRQEKQKALHDLKAQVAEFSLEIARKVLEEELADKEKQVRKIETLVDKISLN